MNKKFAHVIFSFALAIALLIPMFSQTASAQTSGGAGSADVIFITNFNQRVQLMGDLIDSATLKLGPSRVMFVTGSLLGVSGDQLALEVSEFGVTLETLIVARIISLETGIPLTRIVVQLNHKDGITGGELIFNLGLPRNTTMARINAMIDLLTAEINATTNNEAAFIEILKRNFKQLENRFDLLSIRLGTFTFENIVITRLAAETGANITLMNQFRNGFRNTNPNTDIGDFALSVLFASTISPSTGERLGFGFEDIGVITPLGVARELGAGDVPVLVFAFRIDNFQRQVRSDVTTGNTPGMTEG